MNGSKTVLVADDNEDNRTVFRTVLEHVGYGVLEARNGEDAIRMVREEFPDVMIVRRTLPLVDGWEVVRAVRAHPATSPLAIIGMSASCLPEDVAAAEAAGCDTFLAKPCEPRRVLVEVERLIGPARESAG